MGTVVCNSPERLPECRLNTSDAWEHAFAVSHWMALWLSMRFRALITFWKITWNTLYALANQDSNSEPPMSMLNVSDRNSAVSIGCRYGQEHRRRGGTMAHAVVPVPCACVCVHAGKLYFNLHHAAGVTPAGWYNPGHTTGWRADRRALETHRGTPCLLSGEPGQNGFS